MFPLFSVPGSRLFIRRNAPSVLLSSIAALLALSPAPAPAATTYTYSGTATNVAPGDLWSTGTNWTGGAAPVSSQSTILNFTGTLASGAKIFSANDISTLNANSAFLLNQLSFKEAGPSTGTAPTITLSGNPLEFTTDTTAATPVAPVLTFATTGTFAPTVTVSNAIVLDNTLTLTASSSGTLSGVISGVGGINKTGSGTVVLSGTNTFTGGVTITGGALQAVDGTGLPTNDFLNLNGGVLQGSGTSSFTRSLGTSGNAFQWGSGGGGFSANGGVLTVNIGGAGQELVWGSTVGTNLVGTLAFGSSTANNVARLVNGIDLNGATRTFSAVAGTGNDAGEIAGVIRDSQGSAGVIKTGTGTVTFAGNNTYSGTTVISGGFLNISNPNGLGNSTTITITPGSSAALGLSGSITVGAGKTITLNSAGSGTTAGALTTLSGNNVWAGNVILGTASNPGNVRVGVTAASSGSLEISGVISDGTGNSLLVRSAQATETVKFSGQNTYSGVTSIGIGILSTSQLNSVTTDPVLGTVHAAASNLGSPSNAANGVIQFGIPGTGAATTNTLLYTGATDETTDRGITLLAPTLSVTSTIDQSGLGVLKFIGPFTASGAAARSFFLQGSTAGTGIFGGSISDGTGGGILSFTKAGTSTWTLTGTNSWTGSTTLAAGTLNLNSASPLGSGALNLNGGTLNNLFSSAVNLTNSSVAINGNITLGGTSDLGFGTGDVTYGATNRIITLSGTNRAYTFGRLVGPNSATGFTLTINGAGNTVSFAGNAISSSTNAISTTLLGSANVNITGAIVDSTVAGAAPSGLNYQGTGTLTLSGVNTYTGATVLSSGTTVLNGGSLGATSVAVGTGTTGGPALLRVAGDYTIGNGTAGSLTVAGGTSTTGQGTVSLVDGTLNTLTLNNTTAGNTNLALGSATGASVLNFEVGNVTAGIGASDRIAVGQVMSVGSGGAVINLTQLPGTSASAGVYTLLTFANSFGSTDNFVLGTTPTFAPGLVGNFTLVNTGQAETLVVRTATLGATAYWTRNQDVNWNTIGSGGETNFSLNPDGTGGFVLPGSTSDVYFTANTANSSGANTSTNLGQDFSIRSLNFLGNGTQALGNAYTINGINTLTIGSGGVTVDLNSANHSINTPVILAANQTWNLGGTSSQTLTVNGAISGAANLTITGGRTLLLTANNSFGNTSIDTGSTVQIGATGATSTTGSLGTGSIVNNVWLLINRSDTALVIPGVISGTGSLTKAGTGTVTLTGANTYDGLTTVSAGVLNVQNSTALGSAAGGTSLASGAVLQLQGGITIASEPLTIRAIGSSNAAIAYGLVSVSGNNTFGGPITAVGDGANNVRVQSNAGTLTLTGDITGTGTFAAGTGFVPNGAGNITITGNIGGTLLRLTNQVTGTLTLSGANTYAGESLLNTNGVTVVTSINSTNAAGTAPVMASSSLGAPATVTLATIQLGSTGSLSTLRYVGTGETTNRVISLVNPNATLDQSGTGLLKFTANLSTPAATAHSLTFTGSTAGTGEFSGILKDYDVSNLTTIIKAGTGSWTLSGANTYTGPTRIQNGTLNAASLNNVAAPLANSSLGKPTTVTNGTIGLGSTTTTGTLNYTGSGETTDRVLALQGTTGGGGVAQNGAGLLKFTSDLSVPGAASTDQRKTFTLSGSSAGAGEFDGVIGDAVLGTVGQLSTSLAKTGSGTWTLAGAVPNTFTGSTAVGTAAAGAALVTAKTANGGTLSASAEGSLRATSSVSVNNGSTLLLGSAGGSTTNIVNNAATVTLGTTGALAGSVGGTLARAGGDEGSGALLVNGALTGGTNAAGLGTLTLASNSVIDFGTGTTGTLAFDGLLTNGFTLTISNWTNSGSFGSLAGNSGTLADDRLIFHVSDTSLFNNIHFDGYSGVDFVQLGGASGYYEVGGVAAVPEPTALTSALLVLGLAAFRERRGVNRERRRAMARG